VYVGAILAFGVLHKDEKALFAGLIKRVVKRS
jgi:hypothetical protein